MKISTPGFYTANQQTWLSARIQSDKYPQAFPRELWFSVRGWEQESYSTLADPFLIGMLPIAMCIGEDLHVEGSVSARLAHGIDQYQAVLSAWWPAFFKQTPIHYAHVSNREHDPRPTGVGCTFSGGADSFYSVYKSLAPHQAIDSFQLTHALMINGFDQVADFENDGGSRQMYRVYQPILEKSGVQLLMLDSNLKHFRDTVFRKPELVRSYGSALGACAHVCAKLFGRFSLASHGTYRYEDLIPTGSHTVLDPHLSTDQLQIMHTGANASRSEKIEFLANIPGVQKGLRVCIEELSFDPHTGGVSNCCRCGKCLRTLVTLDLLGKVDDFPTFPVKSQDMPGLYRPEILSISHTMFLQDNLRLARRIGHQKWIDVLEQAMLIKSGKNSPG